MLSFDCAIKLAAACTTAAVISLGASTHIQAETCVNHLPACVKDPPHRPSSYRRQRHALLPRPGIPTERRRYGVRPSRCPPGRSWRAQASNVREPVERTPFRAGVPRRCRCHVCRRRPGPHALQNGNGVVLQVQGPQVGLQVMVWLGGMTLALH